MTRQKTSLESMFRHLAAKPKEVAIIGLYKARSLVPPTQYGRLILAFQRAAPRHARLVPLTAQEFNELYWLPSAPQLDVKLELEWAVAWLTPAISKLNLHACRVARADRLLNKGDREGLFSISEESIAQDGWSFWAVSLLIAAEAAIGTKREKAESLERAGAGRISGLLARMMRDRNDASISFPSFEARCKDFISRLKSTERAALYRFRALAEFDDTDDFSAVLASDAISSYVDYYETILSSAIHSLVDSENDIYVARALAALGRLEAGGLSDARIGRIRNCLDQAKRFVPPRLQFAHHPIDLAERCSWLGSHTPDLSDAWLERIHRRITAVEQNGIRASDDADELLRLAANFQSLPTGRSLWAKGIQAYISTESPIVISGFETAIPTAAAYALLTQNDDDIEAAIRAADDSRAEALKNRLEGLGEERIDEPDGFDVWMARELVRKKRFKAADEVVAQLAEHAGIWQRYAKRFAVLSAFEAGALDKAFLQASTLLAVDSKWAYDLGLQNLFKGVSSKQLSTLSSWALAFVSHHANQLSPNSKMRVTCRMACRRVYKEMHKEGIEFYLASLEDDARKVVCAFLAEAWTDENLSMVEEMSTSQEVRRERIEVFQALITIDPGNAEGYTEVIQNLTLDETLWSGLRLIDSNRIFVNEAGITRWAERELLSEYERWRAVRMSSPTSDLRADLMLRSYLVDRDLDALLQGAPSEEQSESGVLLLGVVSKLFSRFLLDPAHGLNSYLSLRVRHGTLRGTLLGPIEEERLLLSGEFSETEFNERWGACISLSENERETLRGKLRTFGSRLDELAGWIVGEKVQVSSATKPEGLFPSRIDAKLGTGVLGLSDPSMSFGLFLNQCYLAFWAVLAPFRSEVARFFREDIDLKIQEEFSGLIADIESSLGASSVRSVTTALRGLATRSSESCRIIASWFVPESGENAETYHVNAAVAIAKKATSNVYRGFQAELDVEDACDVDIKLSTSGLSILYDALFVMLANAWVHSGLGENLECVKLQVAFNGESQILVVRSENALSEARQAELVSGELESLRVRYLVDVPMELVPVEGGSGFAKLARIASAVDRERVPVPMDFGITSSGAFFVHLSIQLYAIEGVFDAYL